MSGRDRGEVQMMAVAACGKRGTMHLGVIAPTPTGTIEFVIVREPYDVLLTCAVRFAALGPEHRVCVMKFLPVALVAAAVLVGACRQEVPYAPMKLGAQSSGSSTSAR